MKFRVLLPILSCFLVLLFIQGCSREKKEKKVTKEDKEQKSYLTEKNKRRVILFFQSEDSPYLIPEGRKIIKTNTLSGQAKQVITQLIAGSREGYLPVLPGTVKLRELVVAANGTAYVDFSRSLIDGSPGGSYSEIRTMGAVVNTLLVNFDRIKRVMILVEGSSRETLLGHIKLDKPFRVFGNLIRDRDNIEDYLAGGESLIQLSTDGETGEPH